MRVKIIQHSTMSLLENAANLAMEEIENNGGFVNNVMFGEKEKEGYGIAEKFSVMILYSWIQRIPDEMLGEDKQNEE